MLARVIGIGGLAGGDDGVGFAVLDALALARVPSGVELGTVAEPSALIDRLEGAARVVLVDAVAGGGGAGTVLVLRPSVLEDAGVLPLSSHGMSVATALALARSLHGERGARDVWIVGVCLGAAPSLGVTTGLSPAVASAVPRAVAAVLGLLYDDA